MRATLMGLNAVLIGLLTSMCGYPIYHNGQVDVKNLLILITAIGIMQVTVEISSLK